jgi:cell division protein ZipA
VAATRGPIIDPDVADEYSAAAMPSAGAKAGDNGPRAEPQVAKADGDQSWENFSTRPAPLPGQLGLDIEPRDNRQPQRTVAAPPGQEKIIVLHVAAKEGQAFAGPAVHTALQLCRLQFGMREVYHRITEVNGVPEAVFSVANMVKPGQLDPMQAQQFRTPGLTLFMVMPGPIDAVTAFRDMLDTAQRLAARLGGDVLDDKRALLTHQSEQYLHDQIAELQRRWRAQPQPRRR